MFLSDARVELEARPALPRDPVLDVVLLGHCPGRWNGARVGRDQAMLEAIRQLGLAEDVRRVENETRAGGNPALTRIPLPLRSFGQFQDLFPDAFDTAAEAPGRITGDRVWLPYAVQDFFEATSQVARDALRLWIVPVPEAEGVEAFLPRPGADPLEPSTLGALERALLIRRAGILAMPDLERLLIPADLPDIPALRITNSVPTFVPCTASVEDPRERRTSEAVPRYVAQPSAFSVLGALGRTLERLRPDMLCLMTVPLAALSGSQQAVPDPDLLKAVAEAIHAPSLRHLQLLFPYLQGEGRGLSSPCGLVAGLQALVSQRHGPWRSIAEQGIPSRLNLWPSLPAHRIGALRQKPGLTILSMRKGLLRVDDERLAAPWLPEGMGDEAWRSAEVARFLGWVRRELRELGERLVFDVDPEDPRPLLALKAFFRGLHKAGALRGARAEDAFTVTALPAPNPSALAFQIELAPAFPIDRIRLTFLQDRHVAGEAHA